MTAEQTGYFRAVDAAQKHEAAAGRASTKAAAVAAAEAALKEYERAGGLATSEAGKRLAEAGAERVGRDLEAYRDPQLWEPTHWSEWGQRGAKRKEIPGFAR